MNWNCNKYPYLKYLATLLIMIDIYSTNGGGNKSFLGFVCRVCKVWTQLTGYFIVNFKSFLHKGLCLCVYLGLQTKCPHNDSNTCTSKF